MYCWENSIITNAYKMLAFDEWSITIMLLSLLLWWWIIPNASEWCQWAFEVVYPIAIKKDVLSAMQIDLNSLLIL